MSDVYFSQKNENGEVGEPEVDMVDQRHPSINSNSNSESSFSLNENSLSLLKGQDPLCNSDTRDDIKSMDFMDVTSIDVNTMDITSITPHVPIHETPKLRTRSNDSSKSDFSEISLGEMSHIRASMSRRASGSLSPRLIEFKRRESIDSFENHEKHHEHKTNELQNLSSQISKSLSSKVEEVIDRNVKS